MDTIIPVDSVRQGERLNAPALDVLHRGSFHIIYHVPMLTPVAYFLSALLVATGLFQYLKLDLCWAGLGAGIGAMNLLVLYFHRTRGTLAAVAAIGCLIAIAQGTILAVQAIAVFADKGMPTTDASMWELIWSGHDFSYAFAYVGAGLSTLAILVRSGTGTSSSRA